LPVGKYSYREQGQRRRKRLENTKDVSPTSGP
jgi:hypothetical protein